MDKLTRTAYNKGRLLAQNNIENGNGILYWTGFQFALKRRFGLDISDSMHEAYMEKDAPTRSVFSQGYVDGMAWQYSQTSGRPKKNTKVVAIRIPEGVFDMIPETETMTKPRWIAEFIVNHLVPQVNP